MAQKIATLFAAIGVVLILMALLTAPGVTFPAACAILGVAALFAAWFIGLLYVL